MRIVASRPVSQGADGALAGIAPWLPPHLGSLWDDGLGHESDFTIVPFVFLPTDASPHLVAPAMREFVERLPGWPDRASRHILLDASDTAEPYDFLGGARLFKTSASLKWREVAPLPFLVFDTGPPTPIESAEYDLCFLGCLETHPIRPALAKWVATWRTLKTSFITIDKPFYGAGGDQGEGDKRRFREQLGQSRFALCPRGRGLNSRRFFEVLALGRIPILYSDAAHLPLASMIDYNSFVVQVPEGMGRWTPDYLAEFSASHDLAAASAEARDVYDRWFAPSRFRLFVEAALSE